MTYRECLQRDLSIMRYGPPWRSRALVFGYSLVLVMLFADVDLVQVEHAPIEQVLLFDMVLLLIASSAGFVARRRLSPLAYVEVQPQAEDLIEIERAKFAARIRASSTSRRAA
jgi:hypothetical protein